MLGEQSDQLAGRTGSSPAEKQPDTPRVDLVGNGTPGAFRKTAHWGHFQVRAGVFTESCLSFWAHSKLTSLSLLCHLMSCGCSWLRACGECKPSAGPVSLLRDLWVLDRT